MVFGVVDGNAANIPAEGGLLVDVDYRQACRAQLHDRRVWTVAWVTSGWNRGPARAQA